MEINDIKKLLDGQLDVPNQFTKGIGELVRTARDEEGMTQKKLAERISKSQVTISDIENGKMDISFLTMVSIALVLGRPIISFFPESLLKELMAEAKSKDEQEFLNAFQYIFDQDLRNIASKQLKVIVDYQNLMTQIAEQGFDHREP